MNYKFVLPDIFKYIKILEIAKEALHNAEENRNSDYLLAGLNEKLEDCGITKIQGSQQKCNPLHSLASYINNELGLKENIYKARYYIRDICLQLTDQVGEFYTSVELECMTKLVDSTTIPAFKDFEVENRIHEGTKTIVQISWEGGIYRTTTEDGGTFGPWKPFLEVK